MLVEQVFSAHLVLPDSSYQDITDGILNVDISQGTEVYEGPYQQIDTGLFTMVSRSSNLDPNVNTDVTEGAAIEFRDSRNVEAGKSNVFFLGYITDIDVQYQREDDPIITITGTDLFGLLQRTVVSEDLRLAGLNYVSGIAPGDPDYNGPSLKYLVNTTGWQFNTPVEINVIETAATPGGIEPALPYDNYLNYAPARYLPELGETLLEILNKYTQTNLNYCSVNYREYPEIIDVYPYAKYNSIFWPPVSDPALEFPTYNFSSDPADGRPYESILLNNGYNRRTKALNISNEIRFADGVYPDSTIESTTTTYLPFKNNENVTEVATSLNTNFSTSFVNNDSIELYTTDIFQAVNLGGDEIQQITFDNARKEDIDNDYTYSFSQLNQFIRIKHQVSENYTIDRFYDIAGVRYNITPDKWEMTFTFKPSQNELAFAYQGQIPTIEMNALSGDSNFNFTATITNYPTEDIDQVFWCLSGTNSDVNQQWVYTAGGERYNDFTPRTGLTQTWNFDDDGILADVPTGGYGTGQWYVIPYIILNNGWVIAPHVMLTVGTPQVEAEFYWEQNLTNNFGQVTFTDDSHNNEIGEPDSYAWTFGDGATSSLQNPIHTYDPAPGQTTYSVSLTVFAYGAGEVKVYNTHTETVTLVQPVMTADYTFTILNSTVTFTNTSTNVGYEEPDAYLWNFGDGTTSTVKNPTKTYAGNEGETKTFNVSLTTRNIWEQTATVTKTITFTLIFSVGNYPVNSIRFRHPTNSFAVSNSPLTPYMMSAKALTSETQSNLLYLRPMTLITSGPLEWRNASGTLTYDNLNLTRDPSITPPASYGMSAKKLSAGNYSFSFEGTLASAAYNLKDFSLTVRDTELQYATQGGPNGNYLTIFVDIMTNLGWTQVGVIPLGRGPMGHVPLGSSPVITEAVKKFVPTRVLPINTLAFNYTITNNNFTVNFTTSLPGPWLWNFGDGTTSTVQNPTKTYSARGTYFVNLNGITEPVKIIPFTGYPFRYIRIKQKLHDGTHAFDTPFIANFKLQSDAGAYETPIMYTDGQEVRSRRISSANTNWMLGYTGTTNFDPLGTLNFVGPRLNYTGIPLPPIGSGGGPAVNGLRVQTINANNTSEWDVVIDYSEPGGIGTRIHDITMDLAIPTVSGYATTVAAGISYEIFATPYTGNFSSTSDPDLIYPGQSWTKIGEINPTGMLPNILKTYSMTPM